MFTPEDMIYNNTELRLTNLYQLKLDKKSSALQHNCKYGDMNNYRSSSLMFF